MKVKDLIKQLKDLPQNNEILCQVVGKDTDAAWNMYFEFNEVGCFIQLRVFHPQLKDVNAPFPVINAVKIT